MGPEGGTTRGSRGGPEQVALKTEVREGSRGGGQLEFQEGVTSGWD